MIRAASLVHIVDYTFCFTAGSTRGLRCTTSGALFWKKSDLLVNPLRAETNYRVTADAEPRESCYPLQKFR